MPEPAPPAAPDVLALRRRIRLALLVVVAGLVVSGLTALFLPWETELLERGLGAGTPGGRLWPALARWLGLVREGVAETSSRYPFLLYGTDWLAFAHFVIALAFLGPLRDPVRNRWVIEFGLLACLLVLPTALLGGALRGIPLGWRLLDCSFGIGGGLPLLLARRWTLRLAAREAGEINEQRAGPGFGS